MNTYDNVVQWYTVRLMLFLTCIMVLNTQETDFGNVFAQSKLRQPVYLQPPANYYDASWGENRILWLNKSINGQAEAPILWYDKFKEGLVYIVPAASYEA